MAKTRRLTMQQALSQAEQAAKKGDVNFAKQLYGAVLQKNPKHVLAKKSLHKLKKGLQRNNVRPTDQPDPSPDQMKTIFSLYDSGEMRKAEQACKKLLPAFPQALKVYTVLGATLIRQGKAEQALKVYDKSILLNPDFAESYNIRGIALKDLGRLEEAIKSYDKAIQLKPDFADAYNNRGNVLKKLGRLEEAITSYDKVVQLKPDFTDAYNNRGKVLKDLGRPEDAIKSYAKAIQLRPDFAEAYDNRGLALQDLGRLEEAIKSYAKAIQLKPDYAVAYNNRGNALQGLGQLEDAIKSYAKAVQLKPDYAVAYNNRGNALQGLGQLEEAIKSYDQAIQLKFDFAEAYYNRGIMLKDLGRPEEAIKSYAKAIQFKPDLAEAYNNLGIVFHQSGRLDKAVENYRKALQANSDLAEVYPQLSSIKKYTEFDADIQAMKKILTSKESDDWQKIIIGFALGKAFEDLKQHENFFQCIKNANHLHRSSYSYSISNSTAFFNRIKKIFSKEFFTVQDDSGQESSEKSAVRAIFILGMPRSGTTLVEQILASHPYVFGAGELSTLSEVVKNLGRLKKIGKYPQCIPGLDQDDFKRLGSAYLNKLAAYRSKDESYITDKIPQNFLYIGLIKKILPRAKVIHCKRDPMDTCFSIFKTFFSTKNSHPYAYEMTELGRYYNLYADLMKHWHKLLPDFVYDIEYENLVMDQEEQTRKLLAYCGLPWDDACLAFHKTKRRVATASSVQVRQPMYTDSVERWKQHAKQLEPLRRAIHG